MIVKFNYKSHKISETDFDALNAFEKRAYILQDHQEETMWWSRTANKIIVLSLILGFFLSIYLLSK